MSSMRVLAGLLLSLTLATGLTIALLALLHASSSERKPRAGSVPDLRIPEPLPEVPRAPGPASTMNANSDGKKPLRYSLTGSLAEVWRESELILLPSGELGGARQQYHARADKEGRYRFTELPAGDYELRLLPRFAFSTRRILLDSDLRIDLHPPQSIDKLACRVRRKDSRAIPRADVQLLWEGRVLDRQTSNELGELVFENVPRARLAYRVWGSDAEEWTGIVDLSGGPGRIDLVLAGAAGKPVGRPVKK
ncbi:MAG: carboxypeptidase-like regulatory domain-containing protein [Planctomycetota bacterium]